MNGEQIGYAIVPERRLRRWWRTRGLPPIEDDMTDFDCHSQIVVDGCLVALHDIKPAEDGSLGRITSGIDFDRKALLFALLRGRLNVEIRHNVWKAKVPVALTDSPVGAHTAP